MAGKEVSVFIVDLGESMGDCHSGRVESDLDYGMRYVWDKIAKIMATDRSTLQIGVIGFRTNETSNPISENGHEYDNISVLKPIGVMKMDDLGILRPKIKPSETESGDALSAIILAVHMIDQATTLKTGKPGKYGRKIFLLTNGQGRTEDADIESIAEKINETGIELKVIGIDFDDQEYGFKEEDKPFIKKSTETILNRLLDQCTSEGCAFGTAAAALEQISVPEPKETKPYSTYKGRLGLGDFEKYPATALYIDVERYFKTKKATPKSASSFANRTSAGDLTQSSSTLQADTEMTDAPAMEPVRNAITYQINDPTAIGGKRDVPREELDRGYEYGSTVVPFGEAEQEDTKFESFKSFSIIGFIPSENYERYLVMGESQITVAQQTNEKARIAFSSLVRALYMQESYAIARIVLADGKDPKILLLAPLNDPNLEALIDVPLPFQEDMRLFRFPPLDRVIGISGAPIPKHRYLPTDDLQDAMDDYIDKMDIQAYGTDDEGNPDEYMRIDETYSPIIHRIKEAICQRAVYPDEKIGPPPEILTKWSNPPSDLVSKATPELKRLIEIAHVQKVPPKAKGKRGKEAIVPLSGLDIEALLSKKQKISRDNAIPEFKQMLKRAKDEPTIAEAAKQMSNIICEMIKDSTGDSWYEPAIANLKVLRHEMIEYEVPELYNNFILDLKIKLSKGQLGDRRDFWLSWKATKLGLIDADDLEDSEVTEDEAAQFWSLETSQLPTRER